MEHVASDSQVASDFQIPSSIPPCPLDLPEIWTVPHMSPLQRAAQVQNQAGTSKDVPKPLLEHVLATSGMSCNDPEDAQIFQVGYNTAGCLVQDRAEGLQSFRARTWVPILELRVPIPKM